LPSRFDCAKKTLRRLRQGSGGRTQMEFRLLGPLEARDNGSVVPLGGANQRAVLVVLLLNANRVVSASASSTISGDNRPRPQWQPAGRRLAPTEAATRGNAGDAAARFVLRLDPLAVDLERFERLVEDARDAEPPRRGTARQRPAVRRVRRHTKEPLVRDAGHASGHAPRSRTGLARNRTTARLPERPTWSSSRTQSRAADAV
jgi:hypothetical protein